MNKPSIVNGVRKIDIGLFRTILSDTKGQVIKVMMESPSGQIMTVSGVNNYSTDLTDIAPGTYLIKIENRNQFRTKKLIINR